MKCSLHDGDISSALYFGSKSTHRNHIDGQNYLLFVAASETALFFVIEAQQYVRY